MGVTDGRLARGNRTREQLLSAAVALFGDRGFHATTMKDLANSAGVRPPAIYNHFESKESVLFAALMWGLQRFRSYVIEPDDSSLDPQDRLEALVRRHARYQIEFASRVRFTDRLLESVVAGELLDDSRRDDIARMMRHYRELVDDLIRAVTRNSSLELPPIRVCTNAIVTLCDRSPQSPRSLPAEAAMVEDDIWLLVRGMLGLSR
ncbi:TetR/AcrR family transcriptional regulator [Mycolicibacterium litorale]|uniref:TetR/AcrR family transcriptional regulator n=1 Tax=Mycolicibacterium litorale TaxID=758802 RepID=UPI001E3FBABC|nr:TetR/AcrR family transcriptional regulator [Mycolicibacterium litorale]